MLLSLVFWFIFTEEGKERTLFDLSLDKNQKFVFNIIYPG